ADRFITLDQSLLGHDLQHFQNSRVAGRLRFVENALNFSHRTRSCFPEHFQNRELELCRTNLFGCHAREYLRSLSSLSTKTFVIVPASAFLCSVAFPHDRPLP